MIFSPPCLSLNVFIVEEEVIFIEIVQKVKGKMFNVIIVSVKGIPVSFVRSHPGVFALIVARMDIFEKSVGILD